MNKHEENCGTMLESNYSFIAARERKRTDIIAAKYLNTD
jgi:hypothetical protein